MIKTIIVVLVVVAALSAGTLSTTSEIPPERTFDEEISRLAKKYDQNESLAREIIRCEGQSYLERGNNKNYTQDGVWWSTDWGYWQINDYWNLETARRRGYDIKNEWQNLEYGFIMLKEEGTWPWNASSHCWDMSSV